MDEREEQIAFMKRYSFGTIITAKDDVPVATHLPFVVSEENGQVILRSHLAKVNPQSEHLSGSAILVIFSEPHAYISPVHYDKELDVPTWNYLSVHAYGRASLISEPAQVTDVLEQTITTYEESYREQWSRLPADYKLGMIKGIVAFEVRVEDLQGKKKLSQNRTEAERRRIIGSFSQSADQNERQIAEFMSRPLSREEPE
jgi:transcriptional regulator